MLLSAPGKVLTRIWEERLKCRPEESLEYTQCGFRRGRSVLDLIFVVQQVSKKFQMKNKGFYLLHRRGKSL